MATVLMRDKATTEREKREETETESNKMYLFLIFFTKLSIHRGRESNGENAPTPLRVLLPQDKEPTTSEEEDDTLFL